MKIGIIGTGKMGSTLGRLWVKAGHTVMFGSRSAHKAHVLAESIGGAASGGLVREAGLFGEVVLLAVPWTAAYEAVRAVGPMGGKTVIDCTNPYLPDATDMSTAVARNSAAEQIAGWIPSANVIKAFNTVHWQHLAAPRFGGLSESLFLCGDDKAAKAVVSRLGSELGLDPIDVGPLEAAHALEAMGYLWTQLAFKAGFGTDVALKLVRR